MKLVTVLLTLIVGALVITFYLLPVTTADDSNGPNAASPKIGSLLQLQIDAKLHQSEKPGRMAMATESTESQRVFIHFEQEPTASQVTELESLGVTVFPETWIPPLPNHPTGFLLADMPPVKLNDVASITSVISLSTAEILCEPQNDLAAAATKADIVWNGSPAYSGTGVSIAILDSGFEVGHPDFPSWMTGGTNYRDYSTDATGPDDYDVANCCTGHGTHVAGIALGRGTSGSPSSIYKGMAYEATPVLLKIGGDSSAGAWPEAIIAAFKAAVDEYNADVITISYGAWSIYHDGSDEKCQSIDYALSQGAVVFAGAGNSAGKKHHYSGNAGANDWSDWIEVTVSGSRNLYYNLVWYDGSEISNDLELHYYQSGTSTQMNPITTYSQSESPRGTESEISFHGQNEELWDVGTATYYLRVQNHSGTDQFFHIYNMLTSKYVTFASPDKDYTIISPAEADGAIAVGACSSRNEWWDYANGYHGSSTTPGGIAGYSSRGPRIDGADKPSVIVPGNTIISIRDTNIQPDNSPTEKYFSNNGPNTNSGTKNNGSYGPGLNNYHKFGGTSASSPHAAGLAALLLEAHPDWTPDQMRYALESTATDKGTSGQDNIWGWGLANVGSAMTVSPPKIVSCNSSGVETNRFSFSDTVYVKGYDLEPGTNYKLWLQVNGVLEGKSLNISEDPSGIVETITTSETGSFAPTAIWSIPVTASSIGEYDIVADNQASGTGTYRTIEDALDSISGHGLTTGIIYVNAAATGNNDGTSWQDAYVNLQQALSNAGSPNQIWVASGTYTPVPPGQSGTRTDSFQMKNGVGIYGGFANVGSPSWADRDWESYDTVLSGEIGNSGTKADNCYHMLYHTGTLNLDNTAVLDGFTISGGYADNFGDHAKGGGMYNHNSSPLVGNCVFTSNYAKSGGGMYNTEAAPTVTNCDFIGNHTITGDGGGMSNAFNSSPEVSDCFFYMNSRGGMVNNENSSPSVSNCRFIDNYDIWMGGGIFNSHNSSPTVYNCVFSGNETIGILVGGGGIGNYEESSPTITNCTFTNNESANVGGGIYNYHNCSPVITNCVFWGDLPDEVSTESGTPVVTYSNIQGGYPGTGNISADPLWVNPGSGDFHLLANSPCLDTGTNSAVAGISEDFEGDARIIDGNHDGTATVDMGVDEAANTRQIDIYVTLQGSHRPVEGWKIPLDVCFCPANSGTDTLLNPGTDCNCFSGTTTYVAPTAGSGTRAKLPVGPVDPGIYDITVDSTTTLLNVKREFDIP